MKEKVQAPELRFDGFTDDWELRKLTNITSSYSGLTYSPTDIQDTGTFVLRSSNVKNDQLIDADNVYVNPDIVNSINVKVGDVIIVVRNGSRALIGKHAIVNEEMPDTVIGAFMSAFRGENGNYINALLSTDNFQKEVHKSLGATINQITGKDFSMMIFPTPKFGEQQKIGAFFKQLDYTIALHQRKLEKSKALKSAYLSDMFPAEGVRKPKRRFAGFTDDWEQRKLKELTEVITKGTTPKDKSGKGSINFVKVENINKISGEIDIKSKITENEHEGYLKRSQLKDGDILFSIAGTLGRTAIVKKELLPANTNQALAIIRLDEGDKNYITTFLNGRAAEDFIKKNPTVGAQPNLSLEQVGNLLIEIPSLEEQTKIGSFFKQLDDTIALHQHKLEKLQNIKQAYLNELFV